MVRNGASVRAPQGPGRRVFSAEKVIAQTLSGRSVTLQNAATKLCQVGRALNVSQEGDNSQAFRRKLECRVFQRAHVSTKLVLAVVNDAGASSRVFLRLLKGAKNNTKMKLWAKRKRKWFSISSIKSSIHKCRQSSL